MSKKYRTSEFAERIGKSAGTVRRWEREGLIKTKRTLSNQRFFDEADVLLALGIKPSGTPQTIVYCRVSSKSQEDDLRSQVEAMRQFCLGGGIAVDEWITEIGGGMNFKRKGFLRVMQSIERREIGMLIVAHKDRFVRFGFDYFAAFAEEHGCRVKVANQEQLSPQQEMVEDLMSIIHTFSCRLYGLRGYKDKIKKAAMA
jgi:predicted site-specific integrase-resolvase